MIGPCRLLPGSRPLEVFCSLKLTLTRGRACSSQGLLPPGGLRAHSSRGVPHPRPCSGGSLFRTFVLWQLLAKHVCSSLHAGRLYSVDGASGFTALIGAGYLLGQLLDDSSTFMAIRKLSYLIVKNQASIRKENFRLFPSYE